jgi:hypothetical protein
VPALARVFGGTGVVVESEADLDAVEIPGAGLFVVDVRIDPQINGRGRVRLTGRAVAGRPA